MLRVIITPFIVILTINFAIAELFRLLCPRSEHFENLSGILPFPRINAQRNTSFASFYRQAVTIFQGKQRVY